MPKDSTVSELDRLYESSKAVKRPLIGQAFLNAAYFGGRQWVMFDGNRIFEPPLDRARAKLTDNRIRPAVLTRVAKKTKTRPTWVGVPRTAADDDIAAARYAEVALDHYWKDLRLESKLRLASIWADVAFAAFWKVWWDRNRGHPMKVLVYNDDHPAAGQLVKNAYDAPLKPDDADETLPAETRAQVSERTVNMGDVCVDLKTFFDIYPDPLASEEGLESADFLIEESVYSPDYVNEQYGEDLPPDAVPSPGIAEARLPTSITGTGDPQGYKGVRLREYWHRPGSTHPNGRRVVWADNKVLYEGDNPYPWLPYVMFGGSPVPGRFWPDCPTTDLISPQTELNKVKSQIADNATRIGNPPLLEPVTMGEFKWHGRPGEKVRYAPTGSADATPGFMNVPEMPGYVQNQIPNIETSIREVSGQHEVSSSTVPAGVTAASAINLLQEQDDTRLGPDIAAMEQSLTDTGERVLWLLSTYCNDERMLRIAGEDGGWDFEAFKGQFLRGCDGIECQIGSGLPQSKAAKQAAIQQMLNLFIQNGHAPDDRTLRKITREMEVGGLEAFYADVARDARQVDDENRRLSRSEELDINTFDNHEVHVADHDDFRKTAKYRRIVANNPKVAEVFEAHVEKHKAKLAEMAAAMAVPPGPADPNQPPGGGPGAPGPGAPQA